MPSSEKRYLHLSGAFVAGGVFTNLGPDGASVPLPAAGAVHLPMVGGLSKAKLSEELKFKWRKKTLLTIKSGSAIAETTLQVGRKPAEARTSVEIRGLNIDGLELRSAKTSLLNSHRVGEKRPRITFGPSEITGLVLDGNPLKITVDTTPFDKNPTLEEFEAAFAAKKISAEHRATFPTNADGSLHRNDSAYCIGSVVTKIEGKLPEGASIDGHTILWPKFGRIILGEVTMGFFIRRVTMLRLEHSDLEFGSGCIGGSYYP